MAIVRTFPILRRRRGAILLIALVAFWLAQALAFAHASRHVGSDAGGLPASHVALCTDCASMLPLLVVAGGIGATLALLLAARRAPLPRREIVGVDAAVHPAFRSRAPPR
ncbi:MAG: hypothetical protein K0R70_847 [Steroidobacteraceae bacterium]|nr:hypothetical protein [Steroidobacteraceae bacterium]